MDKKLRLEALKARYQIVRDKLLLFGAGFGGSVMGLAKMEFGMFAIIFFSVGLVITFVGILKNILLANALYEEIKGLENE